MRDSIQQTIDELYRAWNAHDAAAIARLYTTEASVLDITSGIVTRGRDAIHAVVTDRLAGFPDHSLEQAMLVIDGNRSADRWVMRGTQSGEYQGLPPTGRVVTVPGATFSEFDEYGLLERETHYVSVPTLLRQLGLH